MTPRQRRWIFLAGAAGLVAFYLWGLAGLPGFGHYPGPYGFIINHIAVGQTNATGVVSAVNFEYRGFDTVGEEFILFIAAAGVGVVLRHLRGERERSAVDEAADRDVPATSGRGQDGALLFAGPVLVMGWCLASHAQTSPSGGFQGGVVLATAFVLIYLSGRVPASSSGSARSTSPTRSRPSERAGSPPSGSPRWRWACRTCTTSCRSAARPAR